MAGEDARYLAEYVRTGSPEAFEKLALRYSKLVFAACMRRLGTRDEAEDASQAVFVILARQAHRVDSEHLASWLHRTAVRAASVAARSKSRRARHEEEAARMRPIAYSPAEPTWSEARKHLDAEIEALPPRLREAVSRHYLAGQSRTELARELGVPEGTVASRLSAGIERLRQRLARRGLLLSGAALGALLASEVTVAVPASLLTSLPHLAIRVAAAGAAAGGAGSVSTIVEGVIKMIFWEKLKFVVAAVLAAGALAAVTPVAIQALAGTGGSEAVRTGAVDDAIKGKVTAVQGETATIAAGRKDGVREGFEFGCKEKGWSGKVVSVADDSATLKLTAEAAKAAVGDLAQTGLIVVGSVVKPQDAAVGPAPVRAEQVANGLRLTLDCKKEAWVRREIRAQDGTLLHLPENTVDIPPGAVEKWFLVMSWKLVAQVQNVSDKPVTLVCDPKGLSVMQFRNQATGKTSMQELGSHQVAVEAGSGKILAKGWEDRMSQGPAKSFLLTDLFALLAAKPGPEVDSYRETLKPGELRTLTELDIHKSEPEKARVSVIMACDLEKPWADKLWTGRLVSNEVEWESTRSEEVIKPQAVPAKLEPF